MTSRSSELSSSVIQYGRKAAGWRAVRIRQPGRISSSTEPDGRFLEDLFRRTCVSRQLVVVDSGRLALLVLGPLDCGAVWTDLGAGGDVAVVGTGEFPSAVSDASCVRTASQLLKSAAVAVVRARHCTRHRGRLWPHMIVGASVTALPRFGDVGHRQSEWRIGPGSWVHVAGREASSSVPRSAAQSATPAS